MIRNKQLFASSSCRRLAGALVFGCLLLRSLIPVGYMPGNLLAGEFMALCPQGLPTLSVHASHHDHADPQAFVLDADSACPIATALLAAAPPPLAPAPPALPFAAARFERQAASLPITSPVLRYKSRAPPRSGVLATT